MFAAIISFPGGHRVARVSWSKTGSKQILAFAFCCVLTSVPPASAGQMSDEEKVVRTAYAKLIYATKIGTIHNVVKGKSSLGEVEDRLAAEELTFVLSNFSSGPLSAVAKQPFGDLVTKPNGEDVLNISMGAYNHTDDLNQSREVREKTEIGALANWETGQNLSEDWSFPLEHTISGTELQNKTEYSRYASYKVTVAFQGRSRTYNAMFWFGTGQRPVLALDNVTNNSALTFLVNASVYPAVLLESSIGQKPGVANWLKLHQVNDASCQAGQRQVCCDLATLACGVAAADVTAALDRSMGRVSQPVRPSEAAPYSPRFLTISAARSSARSSGTCTTYSYSAQGLVANAINTQEHTSGNHGWTDTPVGHCEYNDPPAGSNCIVDATAQSTLVAATEAGTVTAGHCHQKNTGIVNGSGSGDTATASTNAAAVVVSCGVACNCVTNISFSGQNPTFPTPHLWSASSPYTITCASKTLPGSPIVIDSTGQGFHLTSQENGVLFDLTGTGNLIQVAWTNASYGNGFLALDRNGNGTIDSGKELFGNSTDQPRSDDPNGFLALSVFDDPAQGGNRDGVIDEQDGIWPRLRLWTDENHDGISQPWELHSLSDMGVHSIGLRYTQTRRFDEFGNIFRYKGRLNPEGAPRGDNVDRVIYDVFLLTSPR